MCEHPKVALLGAGRVGKTSILHRFMFGTFQETYMETVEDIHRYHVNETGKRLFVNFLDTAGSIPFPAMRQLYIRKAQAFVLVYSITDEHSFLEVKNLWLQIKKVRPNILDVPCVIVGNNLDEENDRQVETFDALNWACSENLGGCFVETSAKNNLGVKDAFSLLLEQFLRKRHEQKGPLKLHCLSLHKLKLLNDLKCRESMRIKKDRKSKLSGKEKPSSAPFCEGKYNSKNNETSKDTNKKDKRVDVSGKLKRSETVGVIDRCKSQIRRKLQLIWNH
jgi:small GTP-binding protein